MLTENDLRLTYLLNSTSIVLRYKTLKRTKARDTHTGGNGFIMALIIRKVKYLRFYKFLIYQLNNYNICSTGMYFYVHSSVLHKKAFYNSINSP